MNFSQEEFEFCMLSPGPNGYPEYEQDALGTFKLIYPNVAPIDNKTPYEIIDNFKDLP